MRSGLWTAMPGIVQSFDPDRMICSIQPAIRGIVRDEQGIERELQMPMLLDCPVVFPGGGGCTLTFPIASGDEALVVFASRCIDGWWQLGGVQSQAELRMHDLSDGFALVGVRSQPRKFSVSASRAQLRSDDGSAFVEIDPASHEIKAQTSGALKAEAATINATASGSASIAAPTIALTGNVTINGDLNVTGTTIGNGINLNTHRHSGVTTGGGTSGGPV